jgi:hypothetical protein
MAGNAQPIFARVGKISFAQLTAAVTGADLSTGAGLIFTGDATNGSIVNEVRVKYLPGTSTVATVFRVWINNNGTLSTTTNNTLISEITIPIITTSNTAATPDYVIPMSRGGIILPPNYRMYATIATYSTGTFMVTAFGGDY